LLPCTCAIGRYCPPGFNETNGILCEAGFVCDGGGPVYMRERERERERERVDWNILLSILHWRAET